MMRTVFLIMISFFTLIGFAQKDNSRNFDSKLYNKNFGAYKARAMVALEYEKEGRVHTFFKQNANAVFELKEDKDFVYDRAFINYEVKDKDVSVSYSVYALANGLLFTIDGEKYELSFIDGGCDMVIGNLDYQYRVIGGKEFLFLNVTDDFRLKKQKSLGKAFITLKKGSFFVFEVDI